METATKGNKKTQADLDREAIIKDSDRAHELSRMLIVQGDNYNAIKDELAEKLTPITDEFDKQLAPIDAVYKPRLESAMQTLKAITDELIEIGTRQRSNQFDVKDNWPLDNGVYLHVKIKTEAEPGPTFELPKFIDKFLAYCDVTFKIDALKKVFTNADHPDRKKLMEQDLDLVNNETIEVKRKKQKANEQEANN